jgi:hypothetical protein
MTEHHTVPEMSVAQIDQKYIVPLRAWERKRPSVCGHDDDDDDDDDYKVVGDDDCDRVCA